MAQRLGNIRSSAIYQGNLLKEWISPGTKPAMKFASPLLRSIF